MKSAQSMQPVVGRVTRILRSISLLAALLWVSGCGPRLTEPRMLGAPYGRDQLWAVAPLANESGASVVDGVATADVLAQEAQQVRGINTVAVNRVIQAMRAVGISAVETHGDALTLMNVLKLDGLIIGTITAYDPYRPMRLGVAVQLYVRPDGGVVYGVDPRALTRSASGHVAPGSVGPPRPVAQAAGVFDAENHETLKQVYAYATGRAEPDSAYGRDIYLVSMELYTRFVCYRLIQDLLQAEQSRLTTVAEELPQAR